MISGIQGIMVVDKVVRAQLCTDSSRHGRSVVKLQCTVNCIPDCRWRIPQALWRVRWLRANGRGLSVLDNNTPAIGPTGKRTDVSCHRRQQ